MYIYFFFGQHNFIDWSYAHNVRNFSMEDSNDASCIWECRDSHLGSLFALTRVVDNVLTCSCGFPGSFNLDKLVSPTFCHMGAGHQEADLGYYNVNCVTDLDEDGGNTVNTTIIGLGNLIRLEIRHINFDTTHVWCSLWIDR